MNISFPIRLIISAIFSLAFGSAAAQTPKKVVATASIFADMTQVLAGNLLEVHTIVPIGGDPHIYEPTPQDARLVAGADLILRNGLTFEGWLNELIENAGTKAEVVTITEGIEPLGSKVYQNSTDPHAWMAASNGLIYIRNIADALKKLDPEHAQAYEFNHGLYAQQLQELDQQIAEQIAAIPEAKRVLITSHDAFQYYGRRYGLQLEAILGVSTDADVQTSDMVRLNKVIRERQVPAVFIESTVNPKFLQQLAADNHVAIGGKLFSDSIGDAASPAPTYYDMLKYNTEVIVKGLTMVRHDVSPDVSAGKSRIWLLALIGLMVVAGAAVFFFKMK